MLPRIAYIDKPRKGLFFKSIRFVGDRIVSFGVWIKHLGYEQVEIHPLQELIDAMEKTKVIK